MISCSAWKVDWRIVIFLSIILARGVVRGSRKKKRRFIHILWISVLPPSPFIQVGGFYNNIIKFKNYPHQLTSPPALSTFFFYFFFYIFLNFFLQVFLIFFFCFGQKQAKYYQVCIKKAKKNAQTFTNSYPHWLTPPLPLYTF